jgi:hypothetical protein
MNSTTLYQTPKNDDTHAIQGTTWSNARLWLALEGVAVFIAAVWGYHQLGGNGWVFMLLLFVPDVAMLGYVIDTRIGAWVYNLAHNYVVVMLLGALVLALTWHTGMLLACIWFAHIGMDRTIGYGLKYATDFKHTHLGRV